jgi:hypothetical protein
MLSLTSHSSCMHMQHQQCCGLTHAAPHPFVDDFDVQFNKTAKSFRGRDWPAYKFNATTRALFPHAAVIVGYDNLDYTWTVLNSCKLLSECIISDKAGISHTKHHVLLQQFVVRLRCIVAAGFVLHACSATPHYIFEVTSPWWWVCLAVAGCRGQCHQFTSC